MSAKFGVFILEIISTGYLGVAITKIRNHIKAAGSKDEINLSQLIIHFGAFGLYLISLLVMLGFYADCYIFNGSLSALIIA